MNNGSWKQNEIDFLTDNIGKLTLAEMAAALGKTELAVKLYMHRHRMNIGPVVKRNLLQELTRIMHMRRASVMHRLTLFFM